MLRSRVAFLILTSLLGLPTLAQEVPCASGTAGEFACLNVDLVSRLPLNATPNFAQSSSDIWGWTDPETGVEYAIVNQYDYTAFVDLSDPATPFVVGRLEAPSEAVARDAKVYADHAFIGTDSGFAPLQVFDLRRLRTVTSPPVEFTADALYSDGTDPHNVTLNEASGFLYLGLTGSGTCDTGLHIVDVRTPTEPAFAGCFAPSGVEFHDLQCVDYAGPDTEYAGREVCFGSAGFVQELMIIDVTDKQNPTLIASGLYPTPAYTHQGWLTEDQRYFVMNDEGDEDVFEIPTRTLVFDVSDLDNPEFAFAYDHPTASTDHNLFVQGDYAYEANYTAGLRVLDLSAIDDQVLTEVAYFDTHPEDDETGFDGAFGVYPYFESGIVVVSDMARGLFVLRPTFDGAVTAEPGLSSDAAFNLDVYPNPLGDTATLTLTLGAPQDVTVAMYDALGRLVATLWQGRASGVHRLSLDLDGWPAGAYVVRAAGEQGSASRVITRAR